MLSPSAQTAELQHLYLALGFPTLRRLPVTLLVTCCRQLQRNGHHAVCRHRGKHCHRSFPHNPWPVVSLHPEPPGTFGCFIFHLNGCHVGCVLEGSRHIENLKHFRQQHREIRYCSPQRRCLVKELTHGTQAEEKDVEKASYVSRAMYSPALCEGGVRLLIHHLVQVMLIPLDSRDFRQEIFKLLIIYISSSQQVDPLPL